MDWYDFHKESNGRSTKLGEGCLTAQGGLILRFPLPDIPRVPRPDKGMPMNQQLALDMLRCSVERAPKFGSVRLPQVAYWVRWEQKAAQQELQL